MGYFRTPSDDDVGTVYFVRCGNLVKIGFTTNMELRLRAMRTDNPSELEVLWADTGTTADEAAYHRIFDEYRVKREWFRYEGRLKEYVECDDVSPALQSWLNSRPLSLLHDARGGD